MEAESSAVVSPGPVGATTPDSVAARDAAAPSLVIFRLATRRARERRFDDAIVLFRRYVEREPRDLDGRLALGRTLAWSGRYAAALAVYDSVLASHATNREAMLARAQTLAWSGRLVEAEGIYVRLDSAGGMDAKKGLARLYGWRGDFRRSIRTWREVLAVHPDDAEALTGLAQVLRWQGHASDAQVALVHALRVRPDDDDARALLQWVRADLRPTASTTLLHANDSDDNRMTMVQLDGAARAPWNGSIGGRYTERDATFAGADARGRAIGAYSSWRPGTGTLMIRVDGGVARHTASLGSVPVRQRTIGSGGLRVSGAPARAIRLGAGLYRTPFDETALLIANGVVQTELAGEGSVALTARISLTGAAGYARLTGGTRDNSRLTTSSVLRFTASPRWSVAAGARQYGYDTTSADGYFSPRRYTLVEGSAQGRRGGEFGWAADVEAGLGGQRVALFDDERGWRVAERIAATVSYRFTPAHEVGFSGAFANAAGPGQVGVGEYRALTIVLRARAGF